MDLGIAGKTAFVAGGSKGMGRSAAKLLAADGCRVAVVAREQAGIDKAVGEIVDAGGVAVGISADLSTREGVTGAVAATTEAFGPPEIVVGQTSDQTVGRYRDAADEDFEYVFRVLTMSQIYLAKATVPFMQSNQWGRFIHINSLVGKEPLFAMPHIFHNTVRPATVAYLRTLAQEVAPDQVTVNVVGPGWTMTSAVEGMFRQMGVSDDEAREWFTGATSLPGLGTVNIPMGRAAEPDEIGGLVAFLASQYAGYLTGEWIAVSGANHYFTF
jgi:NAD(P)-dependent dehydrogenase (short-subunit alcohol dehydrogenase family)